jgi:hypothetical protein
MFARSLLWTAEHLLAGTQARDLPIKLPHREAAAEGFCFTVISGLGSAIGISRTQLNGIEGETNHK